MTDPRARSVVLTGMAFPVGSVLGALFGAVSAPRNAQGLGDMVWVLVWFMVSGAPLTMLTFWFSTSRIEWSWQQRKRSMLRMAKGTFVATGLLIAAIWFGGRDGNGGFVFFALPVCAFVVTQQARRVVRV